VKRLLVQASLANARLPSGSHKSESQTAPMMLSCSSVILKILCIVHRLISWNRVKKLGIERNADLPAVVDSVSFELW
jgi:hypothetical protein